MLLLDVKSSAGLKTGQFLVRKMPFEKILEKETLVS